jgi:hypothetical protein
MAGGCANFNIENMEVSYAGVAIPIKDATNCDALGNVTRKNFSYAQHIALKGATDCTARGNTLYIEDGTDYDGSALRNTVNDYGLYGTGNEFDDNDIYIESASVVVPFLFGQTDGLTATITNNRWHMQDGGAVPALFNYGGNTGRTFDQYKTDIAPTDEALAA